MAKKIWTEQEVKELEQCIRDKVQRKVTLTAGEDTLWGVIKNNKPLTVHLVEEVDFMMSLHSDFSENSKNAHSAFYTSNKTIPLVN